MALRVVAFLLLGQLLWAQTGATVDGTVLNRATHQPVSGVAVTLDRGTAGLAYRAVTDTAGAFRILNVDAGDYLPTFEKTGLSIADGAVKTIHIDAASGPVHLRAEMVPWTRISGHIQDTEGRPIPRVRVLLVPLRAERGSTSGTVATSADDGSYTLATQPGSYRLLADPYQTDGLRRGGLSAPGVPDAEAAPRAWAPTYYPATADPFAARTVTVSTAGDQSGFDVRLQLVPVFQVRGVVLDTRGTPARGLEVKLVPPPSIWWEPEEDSVTTEDNGTFAFARARPGDWHVIAELESGERSLMGYAAVSVKAVDVTGLRVRLVEPFTLPGRVEGAAAHNPDDACETTSVSLISTEIGRDASGEAQENGQLRIPEVYPGRYKVQVCGVPEGRYLASVMLGEHEVLGQEFALAPGSPPLRVVFRANGGTVRGTVAQGAGLPVVLAPVDDALLESMFVATTQAGDGGSFEVPNLRPGMYRAFAFDRIADPDALTDAVFLRSLAAWATTVKVEAGRAAVVELKVVRWPE